MPVPRIVAYATAAIALVLTSITAAGPAAGQNPDPASSKVLPGKARESSRPMSMTKPELSGSSWATDVTVMTRNVFLGSDLGPGLTAPDLDRLIRGAGTILNRVDANDFDKRADAIAHEILNRKPDLVGLQEVANWRTAPCGSSFFPPQAEHVRYDYLRMLMRKLNADGRTYRVVNKRNQFDFEIPANTTGDPDQNHCDINARLTMRDVILARTDGRNIRIRRRDSGTFEHLLTVRPGDLVDVPVERGWLSVDAKVGSSPWFRFVNTHLEAFDDETEHPSVRRQQARELVDRHGPIGSAELPVVLVGDLNSDLRTEVKPGDSQAYLTLLRAGLRRKAPHRPMSCCLHLPRLGPDADAADGSQRDHIVDQIMTDEPLRILRLRGWVTGRKPYRGWWGSDHAGVVSTLLMIKRHRR